MGLFQFLDLTRQCLDFVRKMIHLFLGGKVHNAQDFTDSLIDLISNPGF